MLHSLCPEPRRQGYLQANGSYLEPLDRDILQETLSLKFNGDTENSSVLFLALYGHSLSYEQSKHRVAEPAAGGFATLRKCWREPNEETRVGVKGDSQWHRRSISLQLNQDIVKGRGYEN